MTIRYSRRRITTKEIRRRRDCRGGVDFVNPAALSARLCQPCRHCSAPADKPPPTSPCLKKGTMVSRLIWPEKPVRDERFEAVAHFDPYTPVVHGEQHEDPVVALMPSSRLPMPRPPFSNIFTA
jgi:hypothetical protein